MADFCIDGKFHFPLPNKEIYTNETMIKILKEKSVVEIKGVLEKINKCQLCDLEIGLLCAILLIDPGTYIQFTGKKNSVVLNNIPSQNLEWFVLGQVIYFIPDS